MKHFRNLCVLCIISTLSGCETDEPYTLIESLDDRDYQIEKHAAPTITAEEVVTKYRKFLDYATGEPMYGNAIRRLADIELETAEEENFTNENDEQIQITQRKMEAAIRMYEAYLTTYPHRENVDLILYQLAKAYDLVGDYLGTLTTLNKLVTQYPDSRHYIESQFRRGEMLFALGRYNESEQAYQKIVSQTESSIYREKAMFKHGWALFKQSKHTPALHAFFTIIDQKQKLGFVHDTALSDNMARSEKELLNDTLRVISLSFSYLNGSKGIKQYFSHNGARQYEPLVYKQLAKTYLSKDRFKDAADTYLAFGKHYPNSKLSPELHQQAIEVYKKAKLPSLQLATRVSFVTRYSVFGQYWKTHDDSVKNIVRPILQTHLQELAQHHHTIGRKSKARKQKSKHYSEAVTWYKTYIKSFPDVQATAAVNFLLAEAYNDIGHYNKAIIEFEKTAYH